MKVIRPEFAMDVLLFKANQDEEKTIKVKDAIKTIAGIMPLDIVRCKECKYFAIHSSVYYCAREDNEFRVESSDFCSKGERCY